jgi:ectoine hydroxylase-related dioxygenase (phytanoyl-CoA dioxygenase family)
MQRYDAVRDFAISVWIPLVPVDEDTGCIQVIPGSHKKGLRPDVRVPRNNLIGLADGEVEGMEPVSCSMEPGDVLLFTETLFHRSTDNRSDHTRWSLDIRYFDAGNEVLTLKEQERYSGSVYLCYSRSDPARVGAYDDWAASYDSDGEF